MGLSRARTLHFIALLVLVALALRPSSAVEIWIERAFAPARALSFLALPLSWGASGEVRAAEAALEARADAERAAGRALIDAAQAAVRPQDPGLRAGRGLVHAEVIDHASGARDVLVVRFPPGADVQAGMPVVCGDAYVGRVRSTDPARPGEATVDLVTARGFRVGAAVDLPAPVAGATRPGAPVGGATIHEAPVAGATSSSALVAGASGDVTAAGRRLLVVGGLAARRPGATGVLHLAAHCPSDRNLSAGIVRVREIEARAGEPWCALADGYHLGDLERYTVRGLPVLAVRAAVDFAGGLSHVAILCPPERVRAAPDLAQDPFAEGAWTAADFALAGDPAFWREGRVVLAGLDAGLEDGAALALGAELVGCVTSAGRTRSRASLLGDPGLVLTVLARVEGEARPVPLGRLVSLGRDRGDGSILLRGETVRPRASAQAAVLFTGPGRREVPPGLRIGSCELPAGAGPFVLRVRRSAVHASARSVRVWRGPVRATGEGGGP